MEKDVQSEIQKLEARLEELRSVQVQELKDKLAEAKATVAALEAEIARVTGTPQAATTPTPRASSTRRKRTSSEEVKGGVLKALASAPAGLSQKEIADIAGLNYNTVVLYLKNNSGEFKTTGQFRSKRYFLK